MNEKYMWRCLQLAQNGGGYVAPNPMVGAVLVYDDTIIGEGYHQKYGQAHAEPNAIHSVKDKELLKKSTLYVSLEPCSHYGKTPPCALLIVASGIPRVVIGTLDPNNKVAGRGVEILREAGVEVVVGILEKECRELNKRFFIFHEQKRPFVLLKWAQTSDGFMDKVRTDVNELPLSISNTITRQLTHKFRSENQAIMVGKNTVLLDNPSLTVRNWVGRNPIRVAIDLDNEIPESFHLLDGSVETYIFTKQQKEDKTCLKFIQVNEKEEVIPFILNYLYKQNIHSVLVEGGSKLLNHFIQIGQWDEANVEVSPIEIKNGVSAPNLMFKPVAEKVFQKHKWLSFKNNRTL